jgi:hypothetical protein
MDYSRKSRTKGIDRLHEPLAGRSVVDVMPLGKADLSDWVELMDAVEALCPVWPAAPKVTHGKYTL